MKILLEIPKSLLFTRLDRNHGANRLSRTLFNLLLESKAFAEFYIITDAKPKQLEEFNEKNFPDLKLFHTSHSGLGALVSEKGEPDIAFTSDLAMQRLLQVRNWHKYQFPIVGLVHSLGTRKSFDQLRETIQHISHKDRIICPSEHTRTTVIKLGSQWTRASLKDTCVVIPHGVDTDKFKPAPETKAALRQQLKLPETAKVILHVARINPFTKMDVFPLIQNFERLSHTFKDAHLVLVGENQMPSYFNQIQAYIRKKSLAKRITCITDIDHENMQRYYQASDVFASLSDNLSESFGLSVVEAMSTGIPVLASDIAGYRGNFEDDKQGYYIPTIGASDIHEFDLYFNGGSVSTYGDVSLQGVAVDNRYFQKVLTTLLKDEDKRLKMGAAARKHAEKNFCLKVLQKHYADFFQTTISSLVDDPIINFPETLFKRISHKLVHGLTSTIEDAGIFHITDYAQKVLANEEPLFAFQKHLDTYKMMPLLINLIQQEPRTLTSLQDVIEGCTLSELKRNLLYMLKHDLIYIDDNDN